MQRELHHMAEAMPEAQAMHEADSPDSADYAALCNILLPGQRYSEHLAPQLLTALKQAVALLENLVAPASSANGISASQTAEGDPPPPPPPPFFHRSFRGAASFQPVLSRREHITDYAADGLLLCSGDAAPVDEVGHQPWLPAPHAVTANGGKQRKRPSKRQRQSMGASGDLVRLRPCCCRLICAPAASAGNDTFGTVRR